jgi:hypothetical protein
MRFGKQFVHVLFKRRGRSLENAKIPFIMPPDYKTGGIEYEDINPDSQWSIPTNGGLDFSFG